MPAYTVKQTHAPHTSQISRDRTKLAEQIWQKDRKGPQVTFFHFVFLLS